MTNNGFAGYASATGTQDPSDARYGRYTKAQALTTGEATFPRWSIQGGSLTLATTRLILGFFTAEKTEVVTTIGVISGSTAAAATPTVIRFGLYTVDGNGNGVLVASTANDTTLLASTNTRYTKALSSSYVKAAGQRYALGALVVTGTTAPTIAYTGFDIASGSRTELGLSPRLAGFVNSASDLVGSFADSGLTSQGSIPYLSIF